MGRREREHLLPGPAAEAGDTSKLIKFGVSLYRSHKVRGRGREEKRKEKNRGTVHPHCNSASITCYFTSGPSKTNGHYNRSSVTVSAF